MAAGDHKRGCASSCGRDGWLCGAGTFVQQLHGRCRAAHGLETASTGALQHSNPRCAATLLPDGEEHTRGRGWLDAHPIVPHPTPAAATDRVLTLSGAAPAERISAAACATTDHMPREEALQMLEETCSGGCSHSPAAGCRFERPGLLGLHESRCTADAEGGVRRWFRFPAGLSMQSFGSRLGGAGACMERSAG